MALVVYKRQSAVEILAQDETQPNGAAQGQRVHIWDLPYPVCVDIVSRLSLRDTRCLALTGWWGWHLAHDQLMWHRKLWVRARVINLAVCSSKQVTPSPHATMMVRDPLFVNNKTLYRMLDPDAAAAAADEVDIGHLLSKMALPNPLLGFTDVIEHIMSIFNGGSQHTSYSDPFCRGEGAPTFMLFGPPETAITKKFVLSCIASRGATFDTVGFVKGQPGGVGGGVTVKYKHNLMNLLPVRRARPRLLVQHTAATAAATATQDYNYYTYHPDVAKILPTIDGLICYLDATCYCQPPSSSSSRRRGQHATRPNRTTSSSSSSGSSSDFGCHTITTNGHTHYLDLLELSAMFKTIPARLSLPILVLLARMDSADSPDGDLDSTVEASLPTHPPAMLFDVMSQLDVPWAVCEVEVRTLAGVHNGLNWLLQRTIQLKDG